MIGWIAIYRSIVDHWIWNTSSKRFQRWIDVLFQASWKERNAGFGKVVVHLERGQLVTSTRQLMRRWGTNNTTVTTTLKLFEENGMITCDRGRNMTIITVVNYNKYQRFAALAQSIADEQDLLENSYSTSDDLVPDDMQQSQSQQRHFRVQNQIPIEQDNNIIINNKQTIVVDDAQAKVFFEDFTSQLKIERGCKMFGIQESQYIELVSKIIDEWLFTDETDWSFRHLLNHMRRKLKAQQNEPKANGKTTRGHTQIAGTDEGQSPFSRATIYRAETDS